MHRIGQTARLVEIEYWLGEGTIDDLLWPLLQRKARVHVMCMFMCMCMCMCMWACHVHVHVHVHVVCAHVCACVWHDMT